MKYTVTIPKHKDRFEIAKARKATYFKKGQKIPKKYDGFKWDSKGFLVDGGGVRVVKNSKTAGQPREWVVNWQGLYSGSLHFTARAKITQQAHEYIESYLRDMPTMVLKPGQSFKISLDIYEVKRKIMPDALNMGLWLKWFEDSLTRVGKWGDDGPDYVRDTGRIRYIWVRKEEDRKLEFKVEIMEEASLYEFIIKCSTLSMLLEAYNTGATKATHGIIIKSLPEWLGKCQESVELSKMWAWKLWNELHGSEVSELTEPVIEADWDDMTRREKGQELANFYIAGKEILYSDSMALLKGVNPAYWNNMETRFLESGYFIEKEVSHLKNQVQ